jgi:hypothetical protein
VWTVAEKFFMHGIQCCFTEAVWKSRVETKNLKLTDDTLHFRRMLKLFLLQRSFYSVEEYFMYKNEKCNNVNKNN